MVGQLKIQNARQQSHKSLGASPIIFLNCQNLDKYIGSKNNVPPSRMAQNGTNWLQLAPTDYKGLKIAKTGSKWLQMYPNGSKWLQMAQHVSKWLQKASNGSKWLKMTQMTQNGSKWLKFASNGSKLLHIGPNSS